MVQRRGGVNTRMLCGGLTALLVGGVVIAGDLNPPPGPVTPTMKTLQEVEPRTPLDPADLPIVISGAGSYYITGDIVASVSGQVAITINASDVSLDLMGFRITRSGAGQFLHGVSIDIAASNVAISNGTITECSSSGIQGGIGVGLRLTDLRINSNGSFGVLGGTNMMVTRCTAIGNDSTGIVVSNDSVVVDCVANSNGGSGISLANGSAARGCSVSENSISGVISSGGCTITNCTARANSGTGIAVGSRGVVKNCAATLNQGSGFSIGAGTTIAGCTSSFNAMHGITVTSDCLVTGNNCDSNGTAISDGAGIRTTSGDNRIDSNHVTDNDIGIDLSPSGSGGSLLIRNSASGNTTGFVLTIFDRFGATQFDPAVSGPWDNFDF